MTPPRLDVALVSQGLARSRTHARRIIEEGRARVDRHRADKPAQPVPDGAVLTVVDVPDGIEYASRAAHKLAGALDELGIDVAGLRCLDAGASTGGFTDVLLRRGAARVVAVDIGHDQLAPHVARDPRVDVHDGTSIRGLDPAAIGGTVDLVVADLSFISLRLVIAALARATAVGGRLLVMVKPQFEVGRGRLGRGGVVRDPAARRDAVLGVARAAGEAGLRVLGAGRSALPGQDGNIECFLSLRHEAGPCDVGAEACDMIERALHEPRGVPEASTDEHGKVHGS